MKLKLGAFEELVLLAVGSLGEEAYGVSVSLLLEEKSGKKPSVGALHAAFYRLEEKGCVISRQGGATAARGGRRKRFYVLTNLGRNALMEASQLRMALSENIKELQLGLNEG